jgi:hypothetical protein
MDNGDEIEIELDDLGDSQDLDKVDEATIPVLSESTKASGQLVVHNVAWQSWIPTLLFGLFLIVLGTYLLFVRFSTWTVNSVVSIVLIGNGLVLILSARKETCTFDQRQGKLKVKRTTWRGSHITEYWLLHIKSVTVEEFKDPQVRFVIFHVFVSVTKLILIQFHKGRNCF